TVKEKKRKSGEPRNRPSPLRYGTAAGGRTRPWRFVPAAGKKGEKVGSGPGMGVGPPFARLRTGSAGVAAAPGRGAVARSARVASGVPETRLSAGPSEFITRACLETTKPFRPGSRGPGRRAGTGQFVFALGQPGNRRKCGGV